jgi:hypothetical protein
MSANNNRKNARRNKGNLNQADGNIVQVVINIFSKINFSELNNALSKWFVPALFVMAFKDGRIQLVALPTGQSVQPPTDLKQYLLLPKNYLGWKLLDFLSHQTSRLIQSFISHQIRLYQ